MCIGEFNQIYDVPQNLGDGEVQICGSVKKCQNHRVFYIFWDILDKLKGDLSQECVKKGLYFFRAKLEQSLLISPEK